MKTYYKKDLKQAYLILEHEEEEAEDYQIDMLRENKIKGLLQMSVKHIDNINHYHYDISGKRSLKITYEKTKLKYEDMKRLVNDLLETMKELQRYMLEGGRILLDPEYIFCEKEQFLFCYYPPNDLEIKSEFHKLTEFFVREVDYSDKEGIHMAYTLHKATMEENYSVSQIMEEVLREEVLPTIRYDEKIEQKIEETIAIAENPPEFWNPVKRLIDRKKREKWGYWGEVHVEEDDL